MSFKNQNFSVMAYANGFTLWNYNTEDALADVKSADYFNDVSSFARAGDMILTVTNKSGAIVPAILAITNVENDVVTVSSFAA